MYGVVCAIVLNLVATLTLLFIPSPKLPNTSSGTCAAYIFIFFFSFLLASSRFPLRASRRTEVSLHAENRGP